MREMIFFHKPEEENGYLSNWYPSQFKAEGRLYSSMEQYMMHQKAVAFGDPDIGSDIMYCSDPQEIQRLGKLVQGFSETVWDGIKQIIVYRGLLEKFRQNPDLKEKLLATQGKMLAECSISDKIWGIGLSMTDQRRFDIGAWKGQNLLGFALMEVRNLMLRNEVL